MARKRKEVTPETTEQDNAPAPTPEPTPQPVTHVAAATPTDSEGSTAQAEAREPGDHEHGQERQPHKTFWFQTINLGDSNDSPKMRLGRSNGYQQMQIQFDEKPDPDSIQKLRDAGWKWRGQEGVWSIQLDKEARATSQINAERLFAEIGNTIRQAKGLPATGQGQGM